MADERVRRSEEGPSSWWSRGGGSPGAATRGSLLGAGVLLVAALLVLVNYFGWKYHARLDWTGEDLYSLSEQTERVLESLDARLADGEAGTLEVIAFMAPQGELYQRVDELLRRYEAASPRIEVRRLDPQRNPAQAQRLVEQYGVTTESVVFLLGDERRAVPAADLQELDFSAVQRGGQPEIAGFLGEQAFTGAIVDLVEREAPRVLFTVGHGELGLDPAGGPAPGRAGGGRSLAGLADVLGRDNFELEEWSLRGAERVPEGTDLVVVAGPTAAFTPAEVEVLDRHLTGGGRMLLLLDPVFDPVAPGDGLLDLGLAEWLAGYGLELRRDLVLDSSNRLIGYGPETFFTDSYGAHPVIGSLAERGIPAVVSLARSVGPRPVPEPAGEEAEEEMDGMVDEETGEGPAGEEAAAGAEDEAAEEEAVAAAGGEPGEGLGDETAAEAAVDIAPERPEVTVILRSGATARRITDFAGLDLSEAAGEGGAGPVPLAAVAAGGGLRLAVVGDSDLVADALLENRSLANAALVGNLFNWLVERETLLGIPPRRPEQARLAMDAAELRWSVILVVLVLPALAVVAGVWVWWRRRRVA